MTLEINEPSRYASAAATRALSLAVRAAPVMMDSRTPTTGLMRSVMPGRLPDYRGCAAERRCGPLFGGQQRELTDIVRRIHRQDGGAPVLSRTSSRVASSVSSCRRVRSV
jgi:hypothetical protein